ncbi:MAG: WecB/TagA/CpsF family glycosyltransferase [Tissierellia bacterium]|nr:WecB/TagA/CpsF family glycosyltransferase [Tissierellia bacterium]
MNRPRIKILNTVLDNVGLEEADAILEELYNSPGLKVIHTPNPEIVMRAADALPLAELVNGADLVVADGIGLVWAAKHRKLPLKERVTGYDLSLALLKLAQKRGGGVYLLGAAPRHGQLAMERVNEKAPGTIVGAHHGYFRGSHMGYNDHEEEQAVLADIRASGADILFVGLGFPKQEEWIKTHREDLEGISIAIGNGGVIDVLSGQVKRAPEFWIRLHLEWLYRMIKEPKRLKRQLVLPKFVNKILREERAVMIWPPRKGTE